MLLVIVSAVCAVFLYAASQHGHAARRWHAADQCLLDAQSALEQVKYELTRSYLASPAAAAGDLSWFQTWDIQSIGANPVYAIPELGPINDSAVMVRIAAVRIASNAAYAEVDLVGAAGRAVPPSLKRIIQETLRIAPGGAAAQPFDYAYLLDNSARFRHNLVINGDIRVNGDCRLNNTARINGNRYASGQIIANSPLWTLADYWKFAHPAARPSDPTGSGNIAWPMGYSPDKTKNTYLPDMRMPIIGDISSLAGMAGGRISQQGTDLVVNVYDGPGPDNTAGTADDHCLVLDGTAAPIVIQGAVVVKGDLIIRGRVSGQGTIYAGRNVHIVGGLTYVNAPAWPKPDEQPVQTAAGNADRDLLVLAAKGNVVIGNYTAAAWSKRVWGIMADPDNINPYATAVSDAALGYDSDNDPANGYLFDGRYYVNEAHGGRRLSGAGTGTVPRKYYESSLADSSFSQLCDKDVPAVNAALFSNHGIIGSLGSSAAGGNALLNGALAGHDDLVNHYGQFTLNWDIRLGSQSRERINTSFMSASGGPGGAASTNATTTTTGWREIH